MKVLTLSTVFPNPCEPVHGTFVFERARAVAARTDLTVLAPLAWIGPEDRHFPSRRRRTPRADRYHGLAVHRPTFWYVPAILKPLDGLALYLSVVRTAKALHREHQFDLVDAHFAFPEGFAAALLKRALGVPLVVTLRGTLIANEHYRVRNRAAEWAVRQADQVIAVASPLAERARAIGVPPDRVHLVPNGVDGERFPQLERSVARARLGWGNAGRIVLSAGHLSPRKGFQHVLETLPHLPRDTHFVVVGGPGPEGDVGPELARRAAELGVSERLHLLGARPHAEVALWMNAADVYILASSYEGCPNVLLEALATGTPAVASRVGEVERFVRPGENGYLFDSEDVESLLSMVLRALERTWDRAAIRASMVSRGWDRVAQEVLEVFERAANEERRA